MTPNRAALLSDDARRLLVEVALVIVNAKRPNVKRRNQIAELAQDNRLNCAPHSSGNIALIDDVMRKYRVSRGNAKKMMCRARKMRNETESSRRPC